MITITPQYLKDLTLIKGHEIDGAIKQYADENGGANLLNAQDSEGNTLAHYIAISADGASYNAGMKELLKNADLSIKNNNGQTPVHFAAYNLDSYKHSQEYHFGDIVKYAAKQKYNFSLTDNEGKSVLHIAAIQESGKHPGGIASYQKPFVEWILDAIKANKYSVDLDVLSQSGKSALYYTIDHSRYDEARRLVQAGANPEAGVGDNTPSHLVSARLKELESTDNQEESSSLIRLQRQFSSNNSSLLNVGKGRFWKEYPHVTQSAKVGGIVGGVTAAAISVALVILCVSNPVSLAALGTVAVAALLGAALGAIAPTVTVNFAKLGFNILGASCVGAGACCSALGRSMG
tara:strand:- start:2991 stop:4034 length:1044 start_codon:yes stop_codon:yes gene_type:complete